MRPQTEHNKAGHVRAAALGFVSGRRWHGWRDAKVKCVTCGYELPWYHHTYQVAHREKCTYMAPKEKSDDA